MGNPSTVVAVLLTAALGVVSACAAASPPRYWTECAPTYESFQRYFDERFEVVDPIEGIWAARTRFYTHEFAIVRDGSYEGYDYVAVTFAEPSSEYLIDLREDVSFSSRAAHARRGEIFMALRRLKSDSLVYKVQSAGVLRGETDGIGEGTYVITPDGELRYLRYDGALSQLVYSRVYPSP